MWSNWVEQNWEADEEHDENCVADGIQLARVQFDRNSEGDREVLGMTYCSINI